MALGGMRRMRRRMRIYDLPFIIGYCILHSVHDREGSSLGYK